MNALMNILVGVCCLLSLFLIGYVFGYFVGKSEGKHQSIPRLTADEIIQKARSSVRARHQIKRRFILK